jgi:DNA end-binding protein Ku
MAAPKTMWKGNLKIGLAALPVKIISATNTDNGKIEFNGVHRKCDHKINEIKICRHCAAEEAIEAMYPDPAARALIARSTVVVEKFAPLGEGDLRKGHEYETGKMVFFEPDEIKALKVPSSDSIEITNFIDPSEIEPGQFDSTYFIVPDCKPTATSSLNAFAMFREAIGDNFGIAKLTWYGRTVQIAIQALAKGFAMYTLLSPSSLRSESEIEILAAVPDAVNDRQTLQMAKMLVRALTKPYDFSTFTDDYAASVKKLVDDRVAGKVVEPGKAAAPQPEVSDLMAALKASLDSVQTTPVRPATTVAKPRRVQPKVVSKIKPRRAAAKRMS